MTEFQSELFDEYADTAREKGLLPVKVTDFYLKKVREETAAIGSGGPLYKTVFPTPERLLLFAKNETDDFIDEESNTPLDGAPYIIQKYADRLAFLTCSECFAHCQYCFRTYKFTKESNKRDVSLEEKIQTAREFLKKRPGVKEVILTGGDPLTLCESALECVFSALKERGIRIHTRAVVWKPEIFTDGIIRLLKKYGVRIVFHINHPYEICEVVEDKIEKMRREGVRMYAQFPLLRGINDCAVVITELLEKLDSLYVRPLSVFITEPNKFSASFRVSFSRIEEIIDYVNWRTPSWINAARFVLDTKIGKVRRENIIEKKGDKIIFEREGKKVIYTDFPQEIDEKGVEEMLLWKTRRRKI
ncbi:MAG: radical SAM protein [Spirochaetaceae bacterium]|jgi:lysine 2,3-aminomutase|nr:radical SAM protein [Spirochaetaceae bacterium]